MTTTFKSVISCNILGLKEKIHCTCFDHAFFKAYSYVVTNEFFCKALKFLSIKLVQFDMQKNITWPEKSRKNIQKWNKACSNSNLFQRKLNTPMKIGNWDVIINKVQLEWQPKCHLFSLGTFAKLL
jgi:hypothetical protein